MPERRTRFELDDQEDFTTFQSFLQTQFDRVLEFAKQSLPQASVSFSSLEIDGSGVFPVNREVSIRHLLLWINVTNLNTFTATVTLPDYKRDFVKEGDALVAFLPENGSASSTIEIDDPDGNTLMSFDYSNLTKIVAWFGVIDGTWKLIYK